MTSNETLPESPEVQNKQRTTPTPGNRLAATAVDALLDKKGTGITVIDVRATSGVTDYFVLCTGEVDLQIKALTDSVREKIREQHQEKPWHVEGYEHLQWVLMDYVDVVVHIFTQEKRAFYDLERLWGDAPIESVPDASETANVNLLRDDAPMPTPPAPSETDDQPLS